MNSFLMTPLFGVLDRLWGSRVEFKGKKAVIAAASLGGSAAAVLPNWQLGLALGTSWFAYRSVPFFSGSATGPMALLRHGLILAPVLVIARWQHLGLAFVAPFAAYCLAATALALLYGLLTNKHIRWQELGGKENAPLEVLRGALFGAACAVAISNEVSKWLPL